MRALDFKTLKLLVAVCDLGNIKEAAAQELIEPSAISKRITQLEDQLGLQVLHRGRRGTEPTAAGRVLLEHARSLLFTLEKIEADMAGFKSGITGHVRLAASASAIAESLLDDLAGFMREPEHQNIKVDIEERFSRDIVSLVRDGVVSLGVCWSQVELDGLESQRYRGDELVLAVPTGHPLAQQAQVDFEDTLAFEHVGLPPSTAVYTMLHRCAARAGRPLRYRAVVSNFDAAFRVVSAGLGVSVVPREISRLHSAAGRLQTVSLSDAWARREFSICFRRRQDLTPAARRLLDYLGRQATPS